MADKDEAVVQFSYDAKKVLLLGVDGVTRVSAANPLPTTATISGDVNIDSTSIDASAYVGKASGTNADFTTAYASATTITLSGFPSDVTSFGADDIASVVQIATDGSVTETYTRDDAAMSITANVLTVAGAAFVTTDTFIIYTNVPRPSGGGGASVDAEFKSPDDFTATYTSTTTITLTGVPFTATSAQLVYVKVIPASGDTETYVAGSNAVSLTISSNIITIAGAGTPFASGDTYEVGINSQKKAYDEGLDVVKHIEQAPLYAHRTDVQTLVSASDIGAVDATYVDQGSEIQCDTYNTLGLGVKLTVNDSLTNTIKVLVKLENGATNEYVLETSGDYIKTLGDANITIFYSFALDNVVKSVQVQSAAGTVGATEGTLDIEYTLGWN